MIQDQTTGFFNIKLCKIISESNLISVYQVTSTQTNQLFVAKIFKRKIYNKEEEESFIDQIISYSQLNNPVILPITKFSLFSYDIRYFPAFLTEFMVNESLSLLFEKDNCGVCPKEFTTTKKYIILLGIAFGMKYLHSLGIIHANLNPSNILLDENFYPRISNFLIQKNSKFQKKFNEMNFESLCYYAPEILTGQQVTNKVDVYSFSMILYKLITNKHPFDRIDTFSNFLKGIRKNKRPDLTAIKDESIQIFLSKCWSSDPANRPSFEEIYSEITKPKYKQIFEVNDEEIGHYIEIINGNVKTAKNKTIPDENFKNFDEKLFNEKPADALKYFKQLADKGDPLAMYNYANMKQNGLTCKMDKKEAAKYYKMSADKGNRNAMYNYALMLHSGDGIKVNKREAAKYYKMGADCGDPESMFNYGIMTSLGDGIPVNKKEAALYYKMSADLGNTDSMLNFGTMLLYGDGIAMNKSEGIRYVKMSADKGNIEAMCNYGISLNAGVDIKMNKKEAARYYKMSADKGNKIAMLNYSLMLINGDGIPINKTEGLKYMKKSADCGDSDAMLNYGILLYKGDGIELNKKEAARYFKMSADNGNPYAMKNYSILLHNGDGVPANEVEAKRYMQMAKLINNK